jgi:hypothetical protein
LMGKVDRHAVARRKGCIPVGADFPQLAPTHSTASGPPRPSKARMIYRSQHTSPAPLNLDRAPIPSHPPRFTLTPRGARS